MDRIGPALVVHLDCTDPVIEADIASACKGPFPVDVAVELYSHVEDLDAQVIAVEDWLFADFH